MTSRDSSIVVNVAPPRGGKVVAALKRTSARSVVDGLADRYRLAVMRKAAKLTRDEYALSGESSGQKVVATYSTEGGRYSFSTRQLDGQVQIIRSNGVNDLLDQGSIATGGAGETESLTDRTNADLVEGKQGTDDAVFAQLRRTNAANRRFYANGGSADMTYRATDEVWSATASGGSELVRGPTTNLPGDDGSGETMDGSISLIARINSCNRASYGHWSPEPKKAVKA
jgi:hypothetical protein